ncbi:hypothetical protein GCM10020255_057160 [Rhodococcus baikonurensis]
MFAVLAVIYALRRRDTEVVVPLVLFGAILGAQTLLYVMGSTFPLLRFYISIIPLCFVLVVLIAPRGAPVVTRRPGLLRRARCRRTPSRRDRLYLL